MYPADGGGLEVNGSEGGDNSGSGIGVVPCLEDQYRYACRRCIMHRTDSWPEPPSVDACGSGS